MDGDHHLYQGDIQAPALVQAYRTPPPEVTDTLAGVATQIEAWLAILSPEQQGPFLARLMNEGHDVVDHPVVDAIGQSLLEE